MGRWLRGHKQLPCRDAKSRRKHVQLVDPYRPSPIEDAVNGGPGNGRESHRQGVGVAVGALSHQGPQIFG